MKKLISLLLVITMLFSIALFSVNAYTIIESPYESYTYKDVRFSYEITDDGYAIIRRFGSANVVEFPSEINGYTVKYIGEDLFEHYQDDGDTPTTIIIPDTVTHIYDEAFCYFPETDHGFPPTTSDLKTVKLSKNLEYIGEDAFHNNKYLENIEIPEGVTYIGDGAFSGCEKIDITIPKSILYIGRSAFSNCDSLTKVTIPGTIWGLERGAFFSCDSLKKVVIEEGVQLIPYRAFESCVSLKKVKIPNSVWIVENKAFYNCKSLKTIIIDEELKTRKDSFGYYVNKKGIEKINKKLKVKVIENSGYRSSISNKYIRNANKQHYKSTFVLSKGYSFSPLKSEVGITTKLKKKGETVIKWTSSNPKVAKITKKGKLTTLSKGETEITMTLKDGTTYTRKLKVQ